MEKKNYHVNDIFKELEEIYGYLLIIGTQLNEVVFEKLKIIRGWRRPINDLHDPEDCIKPEGRGELFYQLFNRRKIV